MSDKPPPFNPMENYCPMHGYIRGDYDRIQWLTHLRGPKRTAMNLAIDRHNDIVAEQMDAYKALMGPHYETLSAGCHAAGERFRKDVKEAEERHIRALRKLMRPLLTDKQLKDAAVYHRHWTSAQNLLDDMWRGYIKPVVDKLDAFREDLLPPSKKRGAQRNPYPRVQRPKTGSEKAKAMEAAKVAKLVGAYTNKLEAK